MSASPSRNRFYFNDSLNVRSYDLRAEQDAQRFEDHLPFYVAAAAASGGPVLDLGCGTGRLTLAMATTAAVEVVGLELAPAMLAHANNKHAAADPEIRARLSFVAGDMTDFAFSQRFALIVIPFRSFQEILTVYDQRAALSCIRDHLTDDGRLVFDLQDPRLEDVLVREDDEPVALPPLDLGETMLIAHILERHNNPLTQVLSEVWRFAELDRAGHPFCIEEEIHSLRWTWRSEMRHLLELCGLTPITEYADFHGSPPAYGRQQVWVAGKK